MQIHILYCNQRHFLEMDNFEDIFDGCDFDDLEFPGVINAEFLLTQEENSLLHNLSIDDGTCHLILLFDHFCNS